MTKKIFRNSAFPLLAVFVLSSLLSGCGPQKLSTEEKRANFEKCKTEYLAMNPPKDVAQNKASYDAAAQRTCSPLLSAEKEEVAKFPGPNPWDCKEGNDGLGRTLTCQSWAKDPDTSYWYLLTLGCFSDLSSSNVIMGLDDEDRTIYWSLSENARAKIRIDDKPIQEWRYLVDGINEQYPAIGGEYLYFYQYEGSVLSNLSSEQLAEVRSAASKILLNNLEGAKTFGFQAYDSAGRRTSAIFNVDNRFFPISKLKEMGCLR